MAHTADILKKSVVSISPKDSVAAAARVMKEKNIGSILVGDPATPSGIFTERDIARRVVADGLDPRKTPVSAVMTKKFVTVESHESLERVFACLAKGQFRHLPITEGGKVVGIMSLSDLAKVLGEMYRDEKFLESFAGGVKD